MSEFEFNPSDDDIEIFRRFGQAMELLAEAISKLAEEWGPKFAEIQREIVALDEQQALKTRQRQPVLIDPRMSRGKGGKVRWRRK